MNESCFPEASFLETCRRIILECGGDEYDGNPNDQKREDLVKAGASYDLLDAFQLKSTVLTPVVCKAVRCLARNRTNKEVLTNDCGAAVILALQENVTDRELVREACLALANMACGNEVNATTLVKENAIPAIVEAVTLHMTDADVVMDILLAIEALAQSHELQGEECCLAVTNVLAKHPLNRDIALQSSLAIISLAKGNIKHAEIFKTARIYDFLLVLRREHVDATNEIDEALGSVYTKWDIYHMFEKHDFVPPPWESPLAFQPLEAILNQHFPDDRSTLSAIEFGCGASATAVWLSSMFTRVTAIDISEFAISRAKSILGADKVNWIVGDIFDFPKVSKEKYDFLFDMQCFHAIDNKSAVVACVKACLKPATGVAVVVVGAKTDDGEVITKGPPRLTKKEILSPFEAAGFEVMTCDIGQFNQTVFYSSTFGEPPQCWIAILRHHDFD